MENPIKTAHLSISYLIQFSRQILKFNSRFNYPCTLFSVTCIGNYRNIDFFKFKFILNNRNVKITFSGSNETESLSL